MLQQCPLFVECRVYNQKPKPKPKPEPNPKPKPKP